MLGCRGEVGSDGAELLCASECTQAAGDLLPEPNHADLPFGGVVVERASQWVAGEAQVVIKAVAHPAGQRV